MEAKKLNLDFSLVAGGALALSAVLRVFNVLRFAKYYFNFPGLLIAAGFGFVAAMLVMKRRDQMMLISLSVLSVLMLLWGGLVNFVAAALLLVLALTMNTEYLPQAKALAQKIWFVPAILAALGSIVNMFAGRFAVYSLLDLLLVAGGFALAGLWLVYPEGAPEDLFASVAGNHEAAGATTVSAPVADGYCELFKHTLLLLLTFGIWYLIWIYRMTRYLNRVGGEGDRNPVTKLLLCMFVPFYVIYWTYKSAQRIDKLGAAVGVNSRMTTLCLILATFLPVVAPILMQDKINTIIDVERGARKQDFDPAEKPVLTMKMPLSAVAGYCDLFKHVLLLFITFGIWNLIWIYRTTGYLNRVSGEAERNPVTKLLLCMFVPFYMVYWNYKSAQRIDKLAAETGVKSDLTVLCLVLSVVAGILPVILMQDKINEIVAAENSEPAPVLEAHAEV